MNRRNKQIRVKSPLRLIKKAFELTFFFLLGVVYNSSSTKRRNDKEEAFLNYFVNTPDEVPTSSARSVEQVNVSGEKGNTPSQVSSILKSDAAISITSKEEKQNNKTKSSTTLLPDEEDIDPVVVRKRYLEKYRDPNTPDFIQVFEDYLPPESLHGECASCRIGNKLYCIGGHDVTMHDLEISKNKEEALKRFVEKVNVGSKVVTIYDVETMKVEHGPNFPEGFNHGACAAQGNVLHVTGGFLQMVKDKQFASSKRHYTLDTSDPNPTWKKAADMPLRRGAHGCVFLKDGKMYCVGGAVQQWGPFANDLMIYDPTLDSWEMGTPMEFPRDHLFEAITALDHGSKIYVAGGRTHFKKLSPQLSNPRLWSNSDKVEIYDMETKTWERKADLLTSRSTFGVIPYHRFGPDQPANLLLIGGQSSQIMSGQGHKIVEEYDVQQDLYYCLPPIAWPYMGGVMGIHDDKLHIVSGAEWIGGAASRRVQIYDLKEAPKPKQCFYDRVPVYDQYERSLTKDKPYPDMNDHTVQWFMDLAY